METQPSPRSTTKPFVEPPALKQNRPAVSGAASTLEQRLRTEDGMNKLDGYTYDNRPRFPPLNQTVLLAIPETPEDGSERPTEKIEHPRITQIKEESRLKCAAVRGSSQGPNKVIGQQR